MNIELPDHLFHVSNLQVGSEDLIRPGRWGEIITGRGRQHPRYFVEHAFERARLEAGVMVSRLTCAYAFESLEVATRYRDQTRADEIIYRVRPTSRMAHRADMWWIDIVGGAGVTSSNLHEQCLAYWRGVSVNEHPEMPAAEIDLWEWLLEGPLMVIERVL